MASIQLKAVTAEAFAPFGLLLPTPALGQPRLELYGELANLRATAKPRLTLATAPPRMLPLTATEMERHIQSIADLRADRLRELSRDGRAARRR